VFVAAAALGGCAGSGRAGGLTEAEMSKLGATLQRIVRGEEGGEEEKAGTTADGRAVYPVIVRAADPEAVRASALPVGSWSGDVATARLTVEQIRRAARMQAVASIRLSGRASTTRGGASG
jgi:hypothetical protein